MSPSSAPSLSCGHVMAKQSSATPCTERLGRHKVRDTLSAASVSSNATGQRLPRQKAVGATFLAHSARISAPRSCKGCQGRERHEYMVKRRIAAVGLEQDRALFRAPRTRSAGRSRPPDRLRRRSGRRRRHSSKPQHRRGRQRRHARERGGGGEHELVCVWFLANRQPRLGHSGRHLGRGGSTDASRGESQHRVLVRLGRGGPQRRCRQRCGTRVRQPVRYDACQDEDSRGLCPRW